MWHETGRNQIITAVSTTHAGMFMLYTCAPASIHQFTPIYSAPKPPQT